MWGRAVTGADNSVPTAVPQALVKPLSPMEKTAKSAGSRSAVRCLLRGEERKAVPDLARARGERAVDRELQPFPQELSELGLLVRQR